MNKEIIESIADRIATEVQGLKWIDLDGGQLDGIEGRPPVAFPCCLLDIAYPLCEDVGGTIQNVTCQVSIRIAFTFTGATSYASGQIRTGSLAIFDLIGEVHTALQDWSTDQLGKFSRLSVMPEKRRDGLKVFRLIYQSIFEEDTAEE